MDKVCKLIAGLIMMYFMFWATFKIGTGLDYWGPFVMACVGTLVGVLYGVAKKVVEKKNKS